MGPKESCELLNVRPPTLAGCRTIREAKDCLAAWKSGALKRAYKSAAKVAHPDIAGGSEKKMKALNAAYTLLRDELQVEPPRPKPLPMPRPPRRSARQGFATGSWLGGTSTTSATTSGLSGFGFDGVTVVIITE